ncbi:MAG: hypothetical protein ABW110_00400 [Steroidobacteraceae bacterium]
MKLRIRDLHSGHALELDCKLEAMAGTASGVTFETRAGTELVITSFTHVELCKIITHFRHHCDIDAVMQAVADDEEKQKLQLQQN